MVFRINKNETYEIVKSVTNTRKYRFLYFLLFSLIIIEACTFLLIPYLIRIIIDEVISSGNLELLSNILMKLILCNTIQLIIRILRRYVQVKLLTYSELEFKNKALRKLLLLSRDFFNLHSIGELTTILNSDISIIANFVSNAFPLMLYNLLFVISITILLLFLQLKLTVFVVVIYILIFALNGKYSKNIGTFHKVKQKKNADLNDFIYQTITGMKIIQLSNNQKNELLRFNNKIRSFLENVIKINLLSGTLNAVTNWLVVLGTMAIFTFGAYLIIEGQSSIGLVVSYSSYYARLYGPLMQLRSYSDSSKKVLVSYKRLNTIMNFKEVKFSGEIDINKFESLEFNKMSFNYNNLTKTLTDLSFVIKRGEKIAIVGESGSGKSTIIDILCGFYEINKGEILVNSKDFYTYDISGWRSLLGVVPQDPIIFNGSLLENIRLNRKQMSYESVVEAARMAEIHDFIISLPDGYNTKVSDNGNNFSGGQKQRIALARVFLSKPEILIFDELSNGLDPIVQRKLLTKINRYYDGKTCIYITHKMDTLDFFDKIIVLSKGTLDCIGVHNELLQESKVYNDLLFMNTEGGSSSA